MNQAVTEYFAKIGQKGGAVTSDAKKKACRKNIKAAAAKRWAGKRKKERT